MKCVIKLFCLAWMIALLTMGCATEQPWWKATPARWARADGAIATLQLHVTDDKGTPVEGATVSSVAILMVGMELKRMAITRHGNEL